VTAPAGELDYARWSRLWLRLGAQDDGSHTFQQLAAAYAEPDRTYHNTAHVQHCLAELDRARSLAKRPDEVEAALWFHDAVYVSWRSDNEGRSALLAEAALADAGVEPAAFHRVAALILATSHRVLEAEEDAQLICDVDLAILGAPAPEFDLFERAIRQEYRWVPDVSYRRSRSAVLRGFLHRGSIYQTADFRTSYEERARHNLEGLLAALAR
jgi:predicted metal-dependent HD superfamily phosphohydrolase